LHDGSMIHASNMIAFLEARKAGLFRRGEIWRNVVAGVVVGIVALPLAMAFAIASGAEPEQGLYTAIVAGLATSMLGGTRVQISGPTGAFIAVLAGITAQYGIAGLQVATLMAGLMLLAMGLLQLGSVIRFIPNPVIVGFTSGIAVIIFVGQWQYFFGLPPVEAGTHFHENFLALARALPDLHPATTGIASSPATACSTSSPGSAACRRRSSRWSLQPSCRPSGSSRASPRSGPHSVASRGHCRTCTGRRSASRK
jgi:SulP family sulfate permease